METKANKYKMPIMILAAFVAIWGILSVLDLKNQTDLGYRTDGNFNIIQIDEGSAAETAGLQVGDHLVSVMGIAMEDSKTWDKQVRASVGETRPFVVQRNGEDVSMDVTYPAVSGKSQMLNMAGLLLGLIFFLCGIWIFTKNKSMAGVLFTVFALLFATVFFNGPYFANPVLRDVFGTLGVLLFLGAFAYMVKYLLYFPEPREVLSKNNASMLIFGPAILLSVIILLLNIFDPDSSGMLRNGMRILFGVTIVYYFGWALLTLIRRYKENSAENRSAKGINLMLLGAVLGLVPILLLIIINTASPSTIIPGADYAFLTLGLIPIFFALALNKVTANAG